MRDDDRDPVLAGVVASACVDDDSEHVYSVVVHFEEGRSIE
jgi:hypothetical protein